MLKIKVFRKSFKGTASFASEKEILDFQSKEKALMKKIKRTEEIINLVGSHGSNSYFTFFLFFPKKHKKYKKFQRFC